MPIQSLVLILMSLIGMGVSIVSSRQFYETRGGTAQFKSFCHISDKMNCDIVTASRYAEFLGFPLSSWVAGWFLGILFLAWMIRNPFWRRDAARVALGLTSFGALMALPYFFIMTTVLKTFCLFCLITEGAIFVSLIAVLSLKRDIFSSHPLDREKLKWMLGTVATSVLLFLFGLNTLKSPPVDEDYIRLTVQNAVKSDPVSVNTSEEFPSLGAGKDTPITIVEFSDFQCPSCRAGAMILNSVLNRYPGQIRIVYRNYPLDPSCNRKMPQGGHPYACEAARIGFCANRMGKFLPVYESYFENQAQFGPGKPMEFAIAAGLDPATLSDCVNSPEASAAVARDLEEGDRLGVEGTPTFFVNGHRVGGPQPLPIWIQIIDYLLKK